MANVLVEESSLQSIANAIRSKNGLSDTYTPSQMSTAILNIPSGGVVPQETYYRIGNLVELTDYSGGWVSSYTIGSTLSISSSSRTDWRIRKAQIENKQYLLSTWLTDSGSYPFIVVDSNNKVIAVPQARWTGGRYCFLDASGYDDTNGLYICVGCGDLDNLTYHFNQIPTGYFANGYVFCAELLTYGGQS